MKKIEWCGHILTTLITPLYGARLLDYFKDVPEKLTNVELLSGEVAASCFSGIETLREVEINEACVLSNHTRLFGNNVLIF